MKTRVLLVDDDPELLDIVRILMHQKESEYEIVTSGTVKDALEKMEKEKFDIVISDYLMPDSTGLDLLEAIRIGRNDLSFIIWTGHSSEEIAIKALNLGANYYILKGSDIKKQINTIRKVIRRITPEKIREPQQFIEHKKVSEFIHRLSHDLTGVMQNIMGYTTLLEEEYNKSYIEGIGRLASKLTARVRTAVDDVDSGMLSQK